MNVKLALQAKELILKDYKHTLMDYFLQDYNKDNKGVITLACNTKNLSCGTVGCIAGRVMQCSLTKERIKELSGELENDYYLNLGAMLLQLEEKEAKALFFFPFDDENEEYEDLREELSGLNPGTLKYAKVVAKAIDRCIERNGK